MGMEDRGDGFGANPAICVCGEGDPKVADLLNKVVIRGEAGGCQIRDYLIVDNNVNLLLFTTMY